MKREFSWGIAGLLAIAATAGLSFQQGGNRSKEGGSSQVERRASSGNQKPPGTQSAEELACEDIAKALRQFLNVDPSNFPLPGSCLPPAAPVHKVTTPQSDETLHLKFVIATLPDPIHTHLPLVFDRMTEAIQQAAQDDQYSYESSWLPWDDKEDRHLLLKDDDVSSDRLEKRESQPGILLFRRNESSLGDATAQKWKDSGSLRPYQDGLVVLIVGEDPTRGIHLEQFRNAVQWIQQLAKFDSSNLARTAILGPSFSGSFHSLEKLLTASDTKDAQSEIQLLHPELLPIYSPTANGAGPIREFTGFLKSTKPGWQFHHFMEIDEVGLERYCRFVNEWRQDAKVPGGWAHPDKSLSIAIISEDETAFGSQKNPNSLTRDEFPCIANATSFYYPRDISSLRAAYQANSTFDSSTPQQLSDVGRGSLPTDLADPEGKEHDTIRSYAGNQTPISQEAYLLGLVNALREAHSEYIILRSTNSLDQIFLARYLHRAYPDGRIVIDGADELFERERGATGMAGTLSISTYPLLERQGQWLASQQTGSTPDHRSFISDFSEATYVALRLLLHSATLNQVAKGEKESPLAHLDTYELSSGERGDPPSPLAAGGSLPMIKRGRKPGTPVADYGLPLWEAKSSCSVDSDKPDCQASFSPPTWISVIGRDGFWAIASLNEDTMRGDTQYTAEKKELEIPASMKVALILLAIFAGFHLWCCAKASFTAKPAFRTHFANPGDNRHIVLIFLGSLFVTLLPLLAAWGCGWFDWHIGPNDTFANIAIPVVLALSFPATFVNVKRINWLTPGANSTWLTNPWVVLCGLLICLTGFYLAFVRALQGLLGPANRFFTYYRSVHLLSGVSPVIPFLALTIGMYLWFWYSLHGLALFSVQDNCRLPDEADLLFPLGPSKPPSEVLRMFGQQTAVETAEAAKPLAGDTVKYAFAIWFALIFLTWAVARSVPIRTLGAAYTAKLILVCLLGCFSLMLAEAWQLLTVWSKLRALLLFLDRMALRRTLAALRGFSWGSVWKMSGNVLDVRYKLMSRQFESLQHTHAALEKVVKKKTANAARCCIAARYCAKVLGALKQDPRANVEDVLSAIAGMQKVATGILRRKLDAARDAILARKELSNALADPQQAVPIEECISALEKFAACEDEFKTEVETNCIHELEETYRKGGAFAVKYAEIFDEPDAGDFQTLQEFQASVAKTSGYLLVHLLIPEWQRQKCSLILEEDQTPGESSSSPEHSLPLADEDHIRNAEEFVCLPYLGFVQNILGRIRTLVMGILWLFVATAVAVSSYPFDPRQGLGLVMLILFLILVGVIAYVYAQMHRDSTLSHVTNTIPGELGGDFWFKLLGFGLAPLLGLLTTVFPSVSDFIFSWLQPGLQSVK
jgi:hypothetical protein